MGFKKIPIHHRRTRKKMVSKPKRCERVYSEQQRRSVTFCGEEEQQRE